MHHWTIVWALGAVLAIPLEANGYGEDIHYTATYALAIAAGWSVDEAHVIASATYGVDHNYDTAATLTTPPPGPDDVLGDLVVAVDGFHRVLKRDRPFKSGRTDYRVGEMLHLKAPGDHGPTKAQRTGDPNADYHEPSRMNLTLHCISAEHDERVVPGSGKRSQDVLNRLSSLLEQASDAVTGGATNSPDQRTKGLIAMGVLLHCQQDSWSHSGWGHLGQYYGHGVEYLHDELSWLAWLFMKDALPEIAASFPKADRKIFDAKTSRAFVEHMYAKTPAREKQRFLSKVGDVLFTGGLPIPDVAAALRLFQQNEGGKTIETGLSIGMYSFIRYGGRLMNGDNPTVRPAQLKGALRESYVMLLRLRSLWSKPSMELEGSFADLDDLISTLPLDDGDRDALVELSSGLSHELGRTMEPMGKTRPACARQVAGHWLHKHELVARDALEAKAGIKDRSTVVKITEGLARVLAAPQDALSPVPRPRLEKIAHCSEWMQAWSGKSPDAIASFVLPEPTYPALVSEDTAIAGGPTRRDVSLEATRRKAICQDGSYRFLENKCEKLGCSTIPAGCALAGN